MSIVAGPAGHFAAGIIENSTCLYAQFLELLIMYLTLWSYYIIEMKIMEFLYFFLVYIAHC